MDLADPPTTSPSDASVLTALTLFSYGLRKVSFHIVLEVEDFWKLEQLFLCSYNFWLARMDALVIPVIVELGHAHGLVEQGIPTAMLFCIINR